MVLVILNVKMCLLCSDILPWTLGLQWTEYPWNHSTFSLVGERERENYKCVSVHQGDIQLRCRCIAEVPNERSWLCSLKNFRAGKNCRDFLVTPSLEPRELQWLVPIYTGDLQKSQDRTCTSWNWGQADEYHMAKPPPWRLGPICWNIFTPKSFSSAMLDVGGSFSELRL